MNSVSSNVTSGRLPTIALWTVKIILAVLFAAAALFKLTGQPMMVDEFQKIGLGQGLRYLAAVIELASAIMIVIPRSALFGAIGLCGICAGALVAQAGPLHGDIIHPIVLGALAASVAWFSRPV